MYISSSICTLVVCCDWIYLALFLFSSRVSLRFFYFSTVLYIDSNTRRKTHKYTHIHRDETQRTLTDWARERERARNTGAHAHTNTHTQRRDTKSRCLFCFFFCSCFALFSCCFEWILYLFCTCCFCCSCCCCFSFSCRSWCCCFSCCYCAAVAVHNCFEFGDCD